MTGTDLVPASDYAALKMPDEDLREVIKENLQGASVNEFDLDRIKIPSGGGAAWEVPGLEGIETKTKIEGIILFSKETRSFWKEELGAGGGSTPPDCSSPDAQYAPAAGNDPHANTPTDERGFYICEQCPNAQFGTSKDGEGAGQACKQSRQLFLLTPDSLIPLVVNLPPTSLKEAKRYMLRLISKGVKYSSVISQIGLAKEKNATGMDYAKATFSVAGQLSEGEAQRISDFAKELRPVFERVEIRQEEVSEPAGGGVEV